MLPGIWLVPCQQFPSSNSLGLDTLVYTDRFAKDAMQECGETSLGTLECINKLQQCY